MQVMMSQMRCSCSFQVILDGKQATLTSFEQRDEPTVVVKISFKPDFPVAAFMHPSAICSKGSRQKELRRSMKKKAPAQAEDASSLPDTEGDYRD